MSNQRLAAPRAASRFPIQGVTLFAAEDIKQWRGEDVLDAHGEKLGKLDEVYCDTENDVPSFDPDAELSADDEAAGYRYYELDYRPAGQGARRLAKH